MTTTNFNTWDEATQVLRSLPQNHDLNTMEAWALAYGIRCIERDKATRNELTRTEQAIKETEDGLSGEFKALKESTDAEKLYLEIESRR